jgi:molybdopterin molybdotransferase
MLAVLGMESAVVRRRPRVSLLILGDELIQPGEPIREHHVYDSNSASLAAALALLPVDLHPIQHVKDDPSAVEHAAREALMQADVLITAGGASVGDYDFAKTAFRANDVQLLFDSVAMKPGKPTIFGFHVQASGIQLVFGLPGNPVSAFVTFLQFVRPAILKMMGATNLDLPEVPAKLAVDLTNEGDRPHYIRGKLEHGKFSPVGRQESHALFGLSQSNALLRLDLGQSLRADETVDVQIWD